MISDLLPTASYEIVPIRPRRFLRRRPRYSSGLSNEAVDGVEMSVADVLADPSLHALVSDEGVLTLPSH